MQSSYIIFHDGKFSVALMIDIIEYYHRQSRLNHRPMIIPCPSARPARIGWRKICDMALYARENFLAFTSSNLIDVTFRHWELRKNIKCRDEWNRAVINIGFMQAGGQAICRPKLSNVYLSAEIFGEHHVCFILMPLAISYCNLRLNEYRRYCEAYQAPRFQLVAPFIEISSDEMLRL